MDDINYLNILSIFFSKFDNHAGPIIEYQAPDDFLSPEVFDKISDYVITGKALCKKVITTIAFGYKILAYPVKLEDKKYERNSLSFAIGMVFPEESETKPFELVLCKLASGMESLEIEHGFLSDEKSKARINKLLSELLRALTVDGIWGYRVDQAIQFYLKIFPSLDHPSPVNNWEVPVLLKDLSIYESKEDFWDPTLLEVVKWIDGVNYVKKKKRF